MTRRGLLLTMTEPPPAMDAEFNAWYDSEHLPERLAIQGFRSARRWVADVAQGEGRYLATYELDSPGVLASAEYLARFETPTPWTRRCLDSTVVFRRWACEQVAPGDGEPHPRARSLLLVAADTPIAGLELPPALQERYFRASSGAPVHVALFEFPWEGGAELPVPRPGWLQRLYRSYAA
jgi:hypothetical protein